jgi:hypothetical protein
MLANKYKNAHVRTFTPGSSTARKGSMNPLYARDAESTIVGRSGDDISRAASAAPSLDGGVVYEEEEIPGEHESPRIMTSELNDLQVFNRGNRDESSTPPPAADRQARSFSLAQEPPRCQERFASGGHASTVDQSAFEGSGELCVQLSQTSLPAMKGKKPQPPSPVRTSKKLTAQHFIKAVRIKWHDYCRIVLEVACK